MNLIFVENYTFDPKYFHSIGIKRIDTRTKEERYKVPDSEQPSPDEWPITIELHVSEGTGVLHKLFFQSRAGEADTISMFTDVIKQLQPNVEFPGGSEEEYKKFLMMDLKVAPPSAKEEGDATD